MGSETMKQSTRLSARLSEKRPEVNSAGQYRAGVSPPSLINQVHQLAPDLANPPRIIIAPSLSISFSTDLPLGLRSINQSPSSQSNIRPRPTWIHDDSCTHVQYLFLAREYFLFIDGLFNLITLEFIRIEILRNILETGTCLLCVCRIHRIIIVS